MYGVELVRPAQIWGDCCDVDAIHQACADFGLRRAGGSDVLAALQLARRLISPDVMSDQAGVELQSHTGCSFHCLTDRRELIGFFAIAPLQQKGAEALIAGTFDARHLDLKNEVARAGERVRGLYLLGAAAHPAGRKAVVRSIAAVHEDVFWGTTIYSRMATADGERLLLRRLGFERCLTDSTLAIRSARKAPPHYAFAGAVL